MLKKLNQNLIFLLFIFLAILRFIQISSIPIFGDEGLYLRLGAEVLIKPISFFSSLQFGVMPVVVVFTAFVDLLERAFSLNPLISMRSIMVISDLLTAVFLYKIGKLLWDRQIAIIASISYLVLPINFFHSRFVLLEPLTNLFAIISLFFATKLFLDKYTEKKLQIKLIILSSLFMLLSYFTKPLALVYFPALFSLPILVYFKKKLSLKNSFWLIGNALILLSIMTVALLLLYVPIAQDFNRHISTSEATIDSLILNFKQNLWRFYWWSKLYFTIPILLLTIASFSFGLIKRDLKIIWLFLWIGSVVLLDTFFSAHFYPRHLYPIAVPIAILCAFLLSIISQKNVFVFRLILIIALIPSLFFIINLITIPLNTSIALEDKQQFFEDWTAGVGFPEVVSVLNQQSEKEKIVVFVDDHVNEQYVFTKIYPIKNSEIVVSQTLHQRQFIKEKLLQDHSGFKKYIILNRYPEAKSDWPVEEFFSYPKGNNRSIKVFSIK